MSNYNHEEIKEKIIAQLKHIFDPEIPVNIYDLGLIYKIDLEEKEHLLYCEVEMTLTSPGCPVAGDLVAEVNLAAKALDEIEDVNVNLTFDPPWDKEKITDEGKDIMMMHGFVM